MIARETLDALRRALDYGITDGQMLPVPWLQLESAVSSLEYFMREFPRVEAYRSALDAVVSYSTSPVVRNIARAGLAGQKVVAGRVPGTREAIKRTEAACRK